MLAAQGIGLGAAGLELLLDRQGDAQGHWGHQLDDESADCRIDDLAGDGLAYASAAAHDVLLADVDRHNATVLLAVVDTHAFAAQSAHHPPLQHPRPLTRGSGPPLPASDPPLS